MTPYRERRIIREEGMVRLEERDMHGYMRSETAVDYPEAIILSFFRHGFNTNNEHVFRQNDKTKPHYGSFYSTPCL